MKNDLRFRKSKSFYLKNNSDFSVISTQSDLERYLSEHEKKNDEIQEMIQSQKRYGLTMNEMNTSISPTRQQQQNFIGSSSFIKLNRSYNSSPNTPKSASFNNSLSNFSTNSPNCSFHSNSPINQLSSMSPIIPYEPSIKILTQPNSQEKFESLNSSTKLVEKILFKLDIDDTRLNQMVENIRKWISQTILARLVQEIESINKMIVEKGYIDSLIGGRFYFIGFTSFNYFFI